MANSDVTVWEMPKLPAEYAEFFEQESNVTPRETVPTLNPGGKRWTIVIDGDSKVLMRKDSDGDEVPLQIFRGFILGYGENRGRTYYTSGYDSAKPGRPACWSEDNIKADARVPLADRPRSEDGSLPKTCQQCPMSIKGSQVSQDGRDTKACKEHLLLALVPNRHLGEYQPLRLKLSITSIYDGKQPEREQTRWFSWSRYLDHLISIMPQNVHTARVLTKIKFDSTSEWPKLLFQAERQVTTEESIPLVDLMREHKATIKSMVSGLIPAGPLGVKAGQDAEDVEEDDPAPVKSAKPIPTKKAAPADDEEMIPPKKAAPKAEAAKDVTPKKAKVPDPDDDDAEVPPAMRVKKPDLDDEDTPPKKVNGAAAATAKAPDDPKPVTPGKGNIKDLLKDWDD